MITSNWIRRISLFPSMRWVQILLLEDGHCRRSRSCYLCRTILPLEWQSGSTALFTSFWFSGMWVCLHPGPPWRILMSISQWCVDQIAEVKKQIDEGRDKSKHKTIFHQLLDPNAASFQTWKISLMRCSPSSPRPPKPQATQWLWPLTTSSPTQQSIKPSSRNSRPHSRTRKLIWTTWRLRSCPISLLL